MRTNIINTIVALSVAVASINPAFAGGKSGQADGFKSLGNKPSAADGPPRRADYLEFSDDGKTVTGYWSGDTYLGGDRHTAEARYQEMLEAKAAWQKQEQKRLDRKRHAQQEKSRKKARARAEQKKIDKAAAKAGKVNAKANKANKK